MISLLITWWPFWKGRMKTRSNMLPCLSAAFFTIWPWWNPITTTFSKLTWSLEEVRIKPWWVTLEGSVDSWLGVRTWYGLVPELWPVFFYLVIFLKSLNYQRFVSFVKVGKEPEYPGEHWRKHTKAGSSRFRKIFSIYNPWGCLPRPILTWGEKDA